MWWDGTGWNEMGYVLTIPLRGMKLWYVCVHCVFSTSGSRTFSKVSWVGLQCVGFSGSDPTAGEGLGAELYFFPVLNSFSIGMYGIGRYGNGIFLFGELSCELKGSPRTYGNKMKCGGWVVIGFVFGLTPIRCGLLSTYFHMYLFGDL